MPSAAVGARAAARASAAATATAAVARARPERGVLRTTRGVEHELARVRARPAAGGTPTPRVVCVPGNPGCAEWYDTFIVELHSLLGGRAEVTTLGYAGHGVRERDGGAVYSFSEQSAHLEAALRHLADGEGGTGGDGQASTAGADAPLILIGHSIGGYFCLEAAREAQLGSRVDAVVGLTPFLEMYDHASPQQRRMRLAAGTPALRALASSLVELVRLMPRFLQRIAIGAIAGLSGRAADIALDSLVRRGHFAAGFRNYVYMGTGEMEGFAARGEYDHNHLRDVARRTALLYTDDDFWAPHAHRDAFAAAAGELTVIDAEGFTDHAFPVCDAQSAGAARDAAAALAQLVPELAQPPAVGGQALVELSA
eukprot:PRCOL_00001274-RA